MEPVLGLLLELCGALAFVLLLLVIFSSVLWYDRGFSRRATEIVLLEIERRGDQTVGPLSSQAQRRLAEMHGRATRRVPDDAVAELVLEETTGWSASRVKAALDRRRRIEDEALVRFNAQANAAKDAEDLLIASREWELIERLALAVSATRTVAGATFANLVRAVAIRIHIVLGAVALLAIVLWGFSRGVTVISDLTVVDALEFSARISLPIGVLAALVFVADRTLSAALIEVPPGSMRRWRIGIYAISTALAAFLVVLRVYLAHLPKLWSAMSGPKVGTTLGVLACIAGFGFMWFRVFDSFRRWRRSDLMSAERRWYLGKAFGIGGVMTALTYAAVAAGLWSLGWNILALDSTLGSVVSFVAFGAMVVGLVVGSALERSAKRLYRDRR